MKHTLIAAIAITALSTSALAGSYYKCNVNGKTVYSQTRCSSDASRQYVPDSGTRGLRQGELDMLERIEAKEAEQQNRKYRAQRESSRKHIGFSDQNRLRNLDRRKRELQKQSRGATVGEGWAISREIDGINDEIRGIRGY